MKKATDLQHKKTGSDWLTVTEKALRIAYWLSKIVKGAEELGLFDWLG